MKPHKHAEIIKAWADGAEIQVKNPAWADWHTVNQPDWNTDDRYEYRIKPSVETPVVRWQWIYRCFGKLILTERFYASEEEFREHNRATEIELLKKADWTRTEFDE